MWVVAGSLLGVVVLASLAGFHTGPHAHVVAAVAGVFVAAWFAFMLADGQSSSLLWALLGTDLVVSVGVGATAWRVLTNPIEPGPHYRTLESEEGVAVSDLTPVGIVRVRGEDWTASSVNGTVPSGSRVQVVRADGVRLEVWGEDIDDAAAGRPSTFDWAGLPEEEA